jgi:ribose transport system substrate-binding protein
MKTLWTITCFIVMGSILGCGGQSPEPSNSENTADPAGDEEILRLAVIPKGTANPFWKTVHAGAAKAEQELGVKIDWIGPENEDDRKQQIDVVQNFISRRVDAIVLAPLDAQALVTPVELAVSRKIPVVIIDSALNSKKQSSFVATDNKAGGRLGAQQLGKVMGGKGKAILLRYNPGSASTDNREAGFLEEMAAKYPDIELVSTNQYAGVTKQSAFEMGQSLLNKFGTDIQGIFCPNESSTFGMMQALKNSGFASKIKFVGFDASQGLIDGLREGTIHGLVAQDPFDMGYQGVKAAVGVLRGETVATNIATQLNLVTPQNVDTPEMRKLLAPELAGM